MRRLGLPATTDLRPIILLLRRIAELQPNSPKWPQAVPGFVTSSFFLGTDRIIIVLESRASITSSALSLSGCRRLHVLAAARDWHGTQSRYSPTYGTAVVDLAVANCVSIMACLSWNDILPAYPPSLPTGGDILSNLRLGKAPGIRWT